jgi:hypothetical protein
MCPFIVPAALVWCPPACCLLLQLFILRKFIEYELAQINLNSDEVYFCSLSSATVVYKGQLTPEQVGGGFCVEITHRIMYA